ncbi:MAG: SUMF1/EgtB/PvdO family nonheme iron enzyme [Planctomycetaceae bacterium]
MKPVTGFLFAFLALLAWTHSAQAAGRKLAVVVGVNAYRPNSGLPTLQHAGSDAAKLSAALRANGFTVFELTHDVARQPGKETLAPNIEYIRDQIEGMLGFPNLGREDSILVALHGHGVQFEEVKTVKKNGKDEEEKTPKFYFCPADATITGIKIANELTDRNHLLPLEELYEQLAGCKATTKLLIVDACRNDPTQPGVFRNGLASATLPKLPPPTGGTAAFFSCKPNQQAVEDPTLQQGVFTHFLVQGLLGKADLPLEGKPAGDGVITLSELSAYVGNNTYAHVYDKYKVRQSPELRGDYDLNLPLAKVTVPLGTRAGEVRSFTDLNVKFCWCPPGRFTMGSLKSETDRSDDEDQVDVTLSQGYWLGQTEVTQGLWTSVMGQNSKPWIEHGDKQYYREGPNYPAVYVSHGVMADGTIEKNSATEFCRKLTSRERAAGRLTLSEEYRLPREAEWEYACRAGTKTRYSFGDDPGRLGDCAWSDKNTWDIGEKYAHTVGTKLSNTWSLHDMHGNVWEWCADWYEKELPGGVDPLVSSGASLRVLRGGGWFSTPRTARSAYRNGDSPDNRDYILGFRVLRSSILTSK